MEELRLTSQQQAAYDAVMQCLCEPPRDKFFHTTTTPEPPTAAAFSSSPWVASPASASASVSASLSASPSSSAPCIPSLVRINRWDEISAAINASEGGENDVVTILTPSQGHHELFRKLDELEGLEKEEATLSERADMTVALSAIVTAQLYGNPGQAMEHLTRLGQAVPRRVCQHPFRKNDIVWVCRTCQADETCVLCHACFSQSNHEGHDVAFYHALAGGCCDCGDPDAWDPQGFCPHHGPGATAVSGSISQDLVERVQGAVPAIVDWMVHAVARQAHEAYRRANHRATSSVSISGDSVSDAARTLSTLGPSSMQFSTNIFPWETADFDDNEFNNKGNMVNVVSSPFRIDPFNVFSTSAASGVPVSSSSATATLAYAEQLGRLGAAQQGLYIVLIADDVHPSSQIHAAIRDFWGIFNFYTDTLLQGFVRALRQFGLLVVYGVCELEAECGVSTLQLWKDGDALACQRIGHTILERSRRLIRHGLFCSICTGDELRIDQRAIHVLQWLSTVARSCDPLCQTVAACILPQRHLAPLLRADFKMSARVTKVWYSLLLTLLAVPQFKSHLAAAYCDTYLNVTVKYARGLGILERTAHALSVQFLNRVTYVVDLVQRRDLLGKLGKAILETLHVASSPTQLISSLATATPAETALESNRHLDPNHCVLTHRRYSPCISDLKCVLNVAGMPRVVASKEATFLTDWIASLALAQWIDPHTWRHWSMGHVEIESRGWVGAFNASISLGSLSERLLGWNDDDISPITDPSSPYAGRLLSCVEMTCRILELVHTWQQCERRHFEPTQVETLDPLRVYSTSLPIATVSARRGTTHALLNYNISQSTPFSFHLPLHRFVSACIRELCLRRDDQNAGLQALTRTLKERMTALEFDDLLSGMIEFPTLILTRAAQVRAGLWRRNGTGLNDQVLNYSEPPFCRTMRDADLLMVQFAIVARPCPNAIAESDVSISNFVNLLIHRLGIFDFCCLEVSRPTKVNSFRRDNHRVLLRDDAIGTTKNGSGVSIPLVFSPVQQASDGVMLLEEFLLLLITFATELPLMAPKDKLDHLNQVQRKLHREVLHRLASGCKTHSELSEVQHVLSHWDNTLLSEEGKLLNSDDASTASLSACLNQIAIRKASERMEPDKWELKRESWETYDPSFFHISLRNHQIAAENRPKVTQRPSTSFGWESRAYAPRPHYPHFYFQRLRRDVTADATVLTVAYRVLHVHCSINETVLTTVTGKSVYEEKSETALARTIHLLTLGAYAWMDTVDNLNWRDHGGGSVGSIFFDRIDPPTVRDWIQLALLDSPNALLDSDRFAGDESALFLILRLAASGGGAGGFVALDNSVRAGAAWLCEFCVKNSPVAESLLGEGKVEAATSEGETEMERRKREAKEKALRNMKIQANKFANMMDVDDSDSDCEVTSAHRGLLTPLRSPLRTTSIGSTRSSITSTRTSEISDDASTAIPRMPSDEFETFPRRLLKSRPRCIICNYDEGDEIREENSGGEGQRKRCRRKADNALGFVGYVQPSTVLKFGGGSSGIGLLSPQDHTGCFVQICSHAVHTSCYESYLSTVSNREERVGKRDEFRCPLCQRLSNCLVPFIDVGADWIESPVRADCLGLESCHKVFSLHNFLSVAPWWVTRFNDAIVWDGQSAFVDRTDNSTVVNDEAESNTRRNHRRRLKKKDLYAAWNIMMRTPRFVQRKLRARGRDGCSLSPPRLVDPPLSTETEETAGETLVWRRLMDQISDISYRADSKRLGDDRLHDYFGEFRHYVVEKHAYNMDNQFATSMHPVDWPACIFSIPLSDSKRQEMSREKLLSKLLLSIQCFTYSVSCEAFEARHQYRMTFPSSKQISGPRKVSGDSVLSKFGIQGVEIDGRLVVLPPPSDQEDGYQPFDGRLGKMRYFALAIMAASGAVASDLVQLVLQFPVERQAESEEMIPLRAPVAEPLLYGHVLTHVVAAMCAACGRERAQSDALEVLSIPNICRKSSALIDGLTGKTAAAETASGDCEGFLKLGLLARTLQVLLSKLRVPASGLECPGVALLAFERFCIESESHCESDIAWIRTCTKLMKAAWSNPVAGSIVEGDSEYNIPNALLFREACVSAAAAATDFLADIGVIIQLLIPGVLSKHKNHALASSCQPIMVEGSFGTSVLDQLMLRFTVESMDVMLGSVLVQEIVRGWFNTAREHHMCYLGSTFDSSKTQSLRKRLFRTQGFHSADWPSSGNRIDASGGKDMLGKTGLVSDARESQSHDGLLTSSPTTLVDNIPSVQGTPGLVAFSSKKTVPLLGGHSPPKLGDSKNPPCPRVTAVATSYTDLYAELVSLLPDCEQIAVCLICGEVLNAGGKGECTKHSYKCGGGTGLFFLLQECSGLVLHKSKAAYMHSPYVDSHGETPQFRGRPLNLDLARYEHLRQLWTSHAIRQTVVAERGSTRQVILPDFY